MAFQITSIVGNNNLIHLLYLWYILLWTQLTILFFPEATFKECNDQPFKRSINNYLCYKVLEIKSGFKKNECRRDTEFF